MVEVSLKYDAADLINGFTFKGHAGYAELGSDIVCAGISALANTTALSLEQLLKLEIEGQADPESGYLDCNWINQPDKAAAASLLVHSMLLGLQEIAKQYPKYLKVTWK